MGARAPRRGLARQRAQQAERGRRERDGLSAAQQPGIRLIQLEVVEPEADRIGDGERSWHAICRAMEERNYRWAMTRRRGPIYAHRWSGSSALACASPTEAICHPANSSCLAHELTNLLA